MLTPYGHTFRIKTRGQTWSGIWAREGKDVCVTSAFGSGRTSIGRRRPEQIAEEILDRLVNAWAGAPSHGRQSVSGRPR